MVLRCSLLGHDYGEAEVEREREERGSEVVVTVTEYEECSRCGDRHLISENTEVTSLSSGTAASTPAAPATDAEATAEPATETTAEADSPADTAEPPVDDTADATPSPEEEDDLELPTDENGEPITDDGEILEETVEPDGNREHGEWPDSEDVGPPVGADDEPAAWPDDGPTADDGSTADDGAYEPAPEEGAELLDSSSDTAFVDAGTPDGDTESEGDHPATSSEPETGIASARSAPLPGESDPRDGVPTEFFCPQCSFLAPGDRGSLRPGDICPECRKGYLGERERQSLR